MRVPVGLSTFLFNIHKSPARSPPLPAGFSARRGSRPPALLGIAADQGNTSHRTLPAMRVVVSSAAASDGSLRAAHNLQHADREY
jgi:hypothetical protein